MAERLIHVRSAGPLGTDWELVEKQPAVEVQWPTDVLTALRRLEASFGARLIRDAAALASSYDAFLSADADLASDVAAFADPTSSWLHHPANDRDLNRALHAVTRHLQSYVGAAGALIDHSRRFRRRYAAAGTQGGNEYDTRIVSDFGGPEAIVITYLRNYALHHSLPIVLGQQGEVTAEGWPTLILIDTTSLLQGGPSVEERDILESRARGIPLGPLVAMYSSRVVTFYEWLFGRVRHWHGAAEQELRELRQELDEALLRSGLDELPWLLEQLDRRKRLRE
jgi:hypothetical protein